MYATVHVPATLALMDMLEESGLVSMVGRISMDRNCPDGLKEESAAASLDTTRKWLDTCAKRKNEYANTKPILTPRFVPACSDDLMRGMGLLRHEFNLPVQSHLSENRKEVAWVKKLYPASEGYGAVYRDFDLLGSTQKDAAPTVMAHCVWSDAPVDVCPIKYLRGGAHCSAKAFAHLLKSGAFICATPCRICSKNALTGAVIERGKTKSP